MRIVYCEGCSRRICTEALDGQLAASADEPCYCQNCCPKIIEPILNPELVQLTINEARARSASGVRKAVSRNRSGFYRAVKTARRRATRRPKGWFAGVAMMLGLIG